VQRSFAVIPLAALQLSGSMAADRQSAVLYVIAHAGLQVTERDVRDIYLGSKGLSAGIRLAPMDNAQEQHDFLSRVLKLDAAKYNTLWTRKSFRDAQNPPPLRVNDADVVQAVTRIPGGIGYVRSVPPGILIIAKYPL
jgi:hypothetical protein